MPFTYHVIHLNQQTGLFVLATCLLAWHSAVVFYCGWRLLFTQSKRITKT
jgi:hypothetical protein